MPGGVAAVIVLSGSLVLLAVATAVAEPALAGSRLWGRMAGRPPGPQPRRYAATVLPIALGYTVAHYTSLLLLDGQRTWILASNPLGRDGVDLFGTAAHVVDLTAIPPDAIAYVQVGAVVLGHVLGVVLAHERALRSAPRARASDQLPLVTVMTLLTVGGLGLLFGF